MIAGIDSRSLLQASSLSVPSQERGSSKFELLRSNLKRTSSESTGRPDIFQELRVLQQRLLGAGAFEPRELLRYQIKAGMLHTQVELLSRLAESGLAAVRRLQNGT